MFESVTIRIEVGQGNEAPTFDVIKGVLCFYSGYFNTALNGRFTEARDNHVKLATEDPKIFELFRMWIHTRRFYQSTLAPSELLSFDKIAAFWIFADAHDVPLLQNVVSDLMLEKIQDSRTFPSLQDLTYIYRNTVDSAPLRELLGGVYRTLCGHELPWEDIGNINTKQGEANVTSLHQGLEYNNLRLSQWQCAGHIHNDGASCQRS